MIFKTTFTRREFKSCVGAIFSSLLAANSIAVKAQISNPRHDIPTPKSLLTEISIALKTGYPLLVFVSLDNCPFCKIAREAYLLPLINEQSVPIVQVNFRSTSRVDDWHQKVLTHDQLLHAWGIKVAPTILFLGKEAREIAPRLVGGSTSDFYAFMLEERIRMAQTAIKNDLVSK